MSAVSGTPIQHAEALSSNPQLGVKCLVVHACTWALGSGRQKEQQF